MTLSVIIPAYESVTGVLIALNSLQSFQTPMRPVEYIVQDDASPTVLFPALIHPAHAHTYRNEQNGGFAYNCNEGAKHAHGDILLFCNQDVYAVPGWSEYWDAALLSAFEDSSVGIVAPRLLFPNGTIQSAAGVFDAAGQPIHRCLGWSNPHHPEVALPREVEWATGAALAFRREVWEQIGGFDTAYRMYWEDVDACMKVREAGYKIMYQPACTLVHSVGSTGGSPHFADGARLFRDRWVLSGKVKAGLTMPTVRFW